MNSLRQVASREIRGAIAQPRCCFFAARHRLLSAWRKSSPAYPSHRFYSCCSSWWATARSSCRRLGSPKSGAWLGRDLREVKNQSKAWFEQESRHQPRCEPRHASGQFCARCSRGGGGCSRPLIPCGRHRKQNVLLIEVRSQNCAVGRFFPQVGWLVTGEK